MEENIKNMKNKSVLDDRSDDEDQDAGDDCGLALEKLNLGPRKKLLVLDIGGLLCHRVYRFDKNNIAIVRQHDASYGNYLVYKRPYCEEFMKFCFERFEVGVWSSANKFNINSALDCIMKGFKSRILFTWAQDECTDSGFKTMEKKDKPIFFKELKKLWKSKVQFSPSNTLLIDDTPYKALMNPPYTAIFPNEYKCELVDDKDLGPKGDLRLYLVGLADADDVPSYVKEHPYGQPAITPDHSDWEYYSNIIRHFKRKELRKR